MQMEMEDAITLDRKSFEALAADSRVRILKSLAHRRKTLSELSQEIGLSNSTMKEHLDVLVSAGLAVQMDEGRKWKYYELTRKGKGIFVPAHKEVKVLIMLAISVLLVVGSFWNFAGAFAGYSEQNLQGSLASEAVPFPMLGGAAAPDNAEGGPMAKAAAPPAEGETPPAAEAFMVEGAAAGEDASATGEAALVREAAAEESAGAIAYGAPSGREVVAEKPFPLLESLMLFASVAIFAFAVYYAKNEA